MKYSDKAEPFDTGFFNDKGLNCQAIFNIKALPTDVIDNLINEGIDLSGFTQLILLAHRGGELWQHVQLVLGQSNNPIDDFSVGVVTGFFQQNMPEKHYQLVYPDEKLIGLQRLGELAGWHYPSPFRVGINADWGSWFAYRAVLLSDTDFEQTSKMSSSSPCVDCGDKSCIDSCPADAFDNQFFSLEGCLQYRLKPKSQCRDKCMSRLSCPVASELQYSDEQLRYHYGVSLRTIEEYYS